MSVQSPAHVLGLPLDRLFALYLAAAAPALAFGGRPSAWPALLAAHALLIVALWPLRPLERVLDVQPAAVQRAVRGVADWSPLLLIPLLYKELAVLNRAVHGGRYFDDTIIAWEQAMFGGQPSREWAAALPHLALSEPLHAAYLSYYFIIFVPPLLLFLSGRRAAFRAGLFALMLAFFTHYLFFIYFPVQGPRYLFPPPGGELANGFFHQLAHRVLEVGSAQGAAFPSSHVGVSVAQTLVVWRYMPRIAPIFAVLTLGLALGAVYGGFHYATDAVAGVVLGTIAFLAAPRVAGLLIRRDRAAD
ncbi:MAG TPA: phosphatase PAP2 family protein [Longimicrobiales bacterium]